MPDLQLILKNNRPCFGIDETLLGELTDSQLKSLYFGLEKYNLPMEVMMAENPAEIIAMFITLDSYKAHIALNELVDYEFGNEPRFISGLVGFPYNHGFRKIADFARDNGQEYFETKRGSLIGRLTSLFEEDIALQRRFGDALQNQYPAVTSPYHGRNHRIFRQRYESAIMQILGRFEPY